MPVNLSIKNVPDDVAEKLKERAKRNHRSLQGELLCILEEAVKTRKLTVEELRQRVKERGLKTGDEATRWIREDRDSR
ncbi:MAG: Arc family DNA-binding protein [Chloroflexi bacterium]|nr:Arc family DNA-binding protein [Chloroflexota bacterium]